MKLTWRTAKVLKVIDGDTTVLQDLQTKKTFKARHIGYNTPETHHPQRGVECYGPEATDILKRLLQGKTVEYAPDRLAGRRDKYRRPLMHLRRDGELVSLMMIRGGLAFAYHRFNNVYKPEQLEAEAEAEAAKRGLWGACQVFEDPRYPGSGDRLTQQIEAP